MRRWTTDKSRSSWLSHDDFDFDFGFDLSEENGLQSEIFATAAALNSRSAPSSSFPATLARLDATPWTKSDNKKLNIWNRALQVRVDRFDTILLWSAKLVSLPSGQSWVNWERRKQFRLLRTGSNSDKVTARNSCTCEVLFVVVTLDWFILGPVTWSPSVSPLTATASLIKVRRFEPMLLFARLSCSTIL